MTIFNTRFFIYFIGALYGVFYAVGGYLSDKLADVDILPPSSLEGLVAIIFMPFALDLYRRITLKYLIDPLSSKGSGIKYRRYEPYSYAVFLVSAGFMAGIHPSFAFTIALWVSLVFIQAGLFAFSLDREKRTYLITGEKYIAVLFLISGFSALIYQVVWQRALFTTFGVNSESVTVIVSVFMFGLGVGSLVGGYVQKRFPHYLLHLFLLLEISIGLFGLVSLDLIHAIGHIDGTNSPITLLFRVYAILAIPTLLMGATLPVLVAFLQGYFHNIGKTVGLLYAFNTIGSAIAAFFTVEMLFVFFGQQTTVMIAALCNFATAYLIFDASAKLKTAKIRASVPDQDHGAPDSGVPVRLPYAFVFVTLLATGYIALSQEILWFRLLGYMTANRPQVFGLLLTAFLVGIAWGALKSKKKCESGGDPYDYLIRSLFYAATAFYLAFPLIAQVSAYINKEAGTILAYFVIAAVACFTGGILPMLIHVGIEKKQGDSTVPMTWLYFANIIGATSGPLLTGFILLDRYTLEANVAILSGITLILLLALLLTLPRPALFKLKIIGAMGGMVLGAWLLHPYLYAEYLGKIQYASAYPKPFKHQLENRNGILTVEASNADIMYGNGIYDGRFNTSLAINNNGIDRAYMIAALHRNPRKMLEIGLSTGAWARVLADYAPLEKMTIVEINRGYPNITRYYPEIAAVLDNPKISLFFDDGRRWLRNHPNEKFDFILMNTSYHWRSNMTNLLSREFLELCRSHLAPGGVIYYNTTGSKDVVYTAAHVFRHVTLYANFVAASDAPFDMTAAEKKRNLLNFGDMAGNPLFERDQNFRHKLDQFADYELKDISKEMQARKNLWLITDDNMAVEYKVGGS